MMPWQLSYAATADLENSELQTDVMRFMAILAFCLVAIFAIVQSMPLRPAVVEEIAPEPVVVPQPMQRTAQEPPRVAKPAPATLPRVVRPRPAPQPVTREVPDIPPKPEPAAVRAAPESAPPAPVVAAPAPAAPARQGLSLQFESDAVLRGLVARRVVSLFAIDREQFYEMTVAGRQIRFAPGAAPAQYHQMVYETVPQEVSSSFQAQHGLAARDMTWGVTLPPATTAQLRRFVQTNYQGSLVITADGALALAGAD